MTATKNNYYLPLDTLRFVAVTLVLVEHWLHDFSFVHNLPFGDLGVDMFFVLSGFLITGILLNYKEKNTELQRGNGHSLKTFFIRRVLRIFPIYWTVVIVTTLANKGLIQEAFPWNMAYLTNFFIIEHGDWAGNFGHFWSLAVEEQFYLIWPFIILFVPLKHLVKIFVVFILIAVSYRFFYYDYSQSYVQTVVGTPGCFDAFGLGGLLAYLGKYKMEHLQRFLKMWWVPLIVIGIYCFVRYGLSEEHPFVSPVFYRLLYGMVTFWVIGKLAYTKLGFLKNILEFRAFIFIGQISYGMYLLHNFVPGFLMGLPLPENALLRFPIYFIALVAISWIAQKLIERPFNNLKKRFVH